MEFDPSQTVWVEKYRPLTINDVVAPDRIKKDLQKYIEDGDFPNLLLSGSPGIGKTTVAKAICNDMGLDWILINASNERGLDTLRTTITNFASTVSFGDGAFKVVILDEFDGASELLQKAMRPAVEEFAKTCRFIFTCNYPNRILDAIHSRAPAIDLSLRPEEKAVIATAILKRCREILKNEGIPCDTKALSEVVKKYFPDFRRILNELQRIAKGTGVIDAESVAASSGNLNIQKLVKCLEEKDFKAMRAWVGANSHQDFNSMFRQIYDSMSTLLQPASIPEAVVILAQYQFRGASAPDPEINMVAFLTEFMASVTFK